MEGFSASLFDRLTGHGHGATAAAHGGHGVPARLTLAQLKDSVARDLEELLNTRLALVPEALAGYPECAASILNYGLVDFAGMCLSSSDDRARICASLKAAIERHEPRLGNVQARIECQAGTINRLSFVIAATLQLYRACEAVNFDAVLQPSSLRYSIHSGARGA